MHLTLGLFEIVFGLSLISIFWIVWFIIKHEITNYNIIFNKQVHSYFTGNSNVIHLNFKWLSISQTFYHSVSISLFNKLPYTPVNLDFKTFKNVLLSWLIKNPFYSLSDIFNVILKKYVLSTT